MIIQNNINVCVLYKYIAIVYCKFTLNKIYIKHKTSISPVDKDLVVNKYQINRNIMSLITI